jgi:hypothetical protein
LIYFFVEIKVELSNCLSYQLSYLFKFGEKISSRKHESNTEIVRSFKIKSFNKKRIVLNAEFKMKSFRFLLPNFGLKTQNFLDFIKSFLNLPACLITIGSMSKYSSV